MFFASGGLRGAVATGTLIIEMIKNVLLGHFSRRFRCGEGMLQL